MATQAQSSLLARQHHPLFAYWHLLSLDAPTVAALWCYSFARAAGQHLNFTIPLTLALATWILYVSDRLLDAGKQGHPPLAHSLQDRHWFHAQHKTAFLAGLAIAALQLGWLTYQDLTADLLRAYIALGALVAVYFLLIHSRIRRDIRRSHPSSKEFAVGIIFASAVTLPAITRAPFPAALLVPATLFAGLCWLNCAAIERWESERDHRSFIQRASLLLAMAAVICAATSSILSPVHSLDFNLSLLEICVAVSSLALVVLDIRRESLSPLSLRVAADAVLLTPLLVLPFLH